MTRGIAREKQNRMKQVKGKTLLEDIKLVIILSLLGEVARGQVLAEAFHRLPDPHRNIPYQTLYP